MDMNFFKSKFFIISLCVALVLVLVPSVLSIFGYTGVLRNVIKTVALPFEWCGNKVADAASGFVSVFTEYDELKEENEKLKEELRDKDDLIFENELLREQNDWLKGYLDLKTQTPTLQLTSAIVVSRESGNYSTVLTVNRGSAHGIKRQMPVITEDGVFGYVSECGLDWAKVVSIIETASSVGVYTERSGVTGVVEGDSLLRQEGNCVMTYIAATADIKVGDRIFTSGNGSVYPSGLLVGEIIQISADESTRTLSATIRPAVALDDIDDVNRLMIVTGYAQNGGTN